MRETGREPLLLQRARAHRGIGPQHGVQQKRFAAGFTHVLTMQSTGKWDKTDSTNERGPPARAGLSFRPVNADQRWQRRSYASRPPYSRHQGSPRLSVQGSVIAPMAAPLTAPITAPVPALPVTAPIAAPAPAPNRPPEPARSPGVVPQPANASVAATIAPTAKLLIRITASLALCSGDVTRERKRLFLAELIEAFP